MARNASSARPLTDHDEIRRWAEERGAKPTCVRGTGNNGDVGMIRLDFHGYSGEGKLEEISWDEWFDKFDESGLALLVQDETARGQRSNFNKLVSRDTVESSERGGSSRSRSRRQSASRDRDEGEYQASADMEQDEIEEDVEESVVEKARPVRARTGGRSSRNRKRQSRVSSQEGSRTRRSESARNRDSQKGRSRNASRTRSRTSKSRRGQATGGSRSSAKKAPARARISGSRTSRARSSSSRKRAA